MWDSHHTARPHYCEVIVVLCQLMSGYKVGGCITPGTIFPGIIGWAQGGTGKARKSRETKVGNARKGQNTNAREGTQQPALMPRVYS